MIIAMILMLFLSAFFSSAETAIITSSNAKVHLLKNKHHKRAVILLKLLEKKEEVIRILLAGNNFVNIASSSIATALTIKTFGDSGHAIAIVTGIMTFVIIIYCEILPKTYAVRHPESFGLLVAPICDFLIRMLASLDFMMKKIVDANLYLLGLKNNAYNKISALDELRSALDHHHEKGFVVNEDRYMLGAVIDLEKISVAEVMVHRKDICSLDINAKPESILKIVTEGAYSRIPFWDKTEEDIMGILHIRDLCAFMKKKGDVKVTNSEIKALLREPWFIPNTTNLRMQLGAFRDKHYHFALVVDEYGELDGLITLEDVVEEIFGQIEDEYDTHHNKLSHYKDGSISVAGVVTVRDINREMHWKIPEDHAATIGGLMFRMTEKIPDLDDVVTIGEYEIKLIKKRDNRIIKLKVAKVGA